MVPKAQRVSTHDASSKPITSSRWLLYVVCFVTGASTLVIELSGNRLLSPLFGNSILTWTSLFGVILVAMSVGDIIGGALVDRVPRLSILGYMLLAAAVWTLAVPLIHAWLTTWAVAEHVIAGPLVASAVLFAVPAFLLASASPFTIRLVSRITADHEIGLSAGVVGMFATLGSFVGTILTGFVLLPLFGVRLIFFMTGLIVATLGVSVFVACRIRPSMVATAVLIVAGLAGANMLSKPFESEGLIHHQQTFYHDVRVEEWNTDLGERVRVLKLDTTLEGGQYVETGGVFMATNLYWRLAEEYCSRLDRALFLGGGGFGMPQDFSRRHAAGIAEVVELDPAVIDIGKRFFRLDEFPKVHPIACDARRFLSTTATTYDMIFCDAYHGVRSIPSHLVTREFFVLVKSRLTKDGVFFANVISPVTGKYSSVFRSLVRTMRTEFAYTEAFSVENKQLDVVNNIIVMASDRPFTPNPSSVPRDAVTEHLLSTRIDRSSYEPLGGMVFTDDYNPSEYLVARQLEQAN